MGGVSRDGQGKSLRGDAEPNPAGMLGAKHVVNGREKGAGMCKGPGGTLGALEKQVVAEGEPMEW